MLDVKIDSTITLYGIEYKCVEDKTEKGKMIHCSKDCDLYGVDICGYIACGPLERNDGKCVYFKKVMPEFDINKY